MSNLKGELAVEFVEWLHGIKWYLPPTMKISEAKELFERKVREDEDIGLRKAPGSKGGARAARPSNVAKFPPNCS